MLKFDNKNVFQAPGPAGKSIQIPARCEPELDPYIALDTLEKQKNYYEAQGYVVCRNLIPEAVCDRIVQAFEQEIKPYDGYIYRQTSSFPEKHQLSENGYILNSIKHIQDLDPKAFKQFIQTSFQGLAHENVREVIKTLLNDESVIVQSMLFEGNPATPPHSDSYYLDSSDIGRMVAVWVALEDIHPGAGRFFVYPGSHQAEMPKNEGDYEISFHHDNYLKEIRNIIEQPGMECRAPALRKGDVLFWNALTIHGSLETTCPEFSRKSLTAHFIPASKDYVLFQKVKIPLNIQVFNGQNCHCPKDPKKFSNQLQMFGLRYFPKTTDFVRKCIIRLRMK
jgi:phytanoyl-CoA hydroxylase